MSAADIPTDKQKVFLLSTVNAQDKNYIEQAPNYGWTWPKSTWLTQRLELVRQREREKEIGE